MTSNGHSEHQLHATSQAFDGSLGIEIIPDGASLIIFVYVGTRKFELALSREEIRALAQFLGEGADR
jgi:hypothetical protein